jgi:hypothetical protein
MLEKLKLLDPFDWAAIALALVLVVYGLASRPRPVKHDPALFRQACIDRGGALVRDRWGRYRSCYIQ